MIGLTEHHLQFCNVLLPSTSHWLCRQFLKKPKEAYSLINLPASVWHEELFLLLKGQTGGEVTHS